MTYMDGDYAEEPLTMEHAISTGLHDAISTTVRLAIVGSAATLLLLLIVGRKGVETITRKMIG